ncbi:MAG: hypothetical protein QOF39_2952 [Frankiales bacterium]|nr:hypothetical protein [Frankiales bacterium]
MLRRIPAGIVLALALGLSGCGSSATGTGVAAAPTTTTSGAATGAASTSAAPTTASGVAYAQCMRDHGVDVPDPTTKGPQLQLQHSGGAPSKVDQRKLNAAMTACKSLLPSGRPLMKPPADALASMRKMAKCMRDNGITKFPDPGANGQMFIDKSSGIDLNSPAFKAAQTKCAKYAPTGGAQGQANGAVVGGK